MMIPYSRQQISDSDIQAVSDVLRSDYLTTGPTVERFEAELCRLTGARHAVTCSNGTTALHLACLALGVTQGDIGVTSPITFLASANCLEFCNGRADFADIDPATLCLSPEKIEEYVWKFGAPKLVIPVDYAGIPADLPRLHALAQKYGFKIIEDAAHSIGSTYTHEGREYACGSCAHTDMATFSFHPVKNITTGEGGAIMTNDDALAQKLRLLRSHGMTKEPAALTRQDGPWYYEMHEYGYNYRLTDIQCAIGFSQLKQLPEFKKQRQALVLRYHELLKDCKDITLPPWPKETSPCFHLYPIHFTKGETARLKAYERLTQADIRPQVHYFPVHLQPYFKEKYRFFEGSFPESEKFYKGALSLPLFPGLKAEEQEQISSMVLESTK
ncbi:MAG: UDP-4-amino-4,6-dideoxy-N-acetyl-beta-L-altrosamine transaminase [Fibrobacterota bacterium]